MVLVTETEDAFFCPRLLFVATGSAKSCVVTTRGQRLLQRLRLHDVGVILRTMIERVNALVDAFLVRVHTKFETEFGGNPVTELDHFAELPRGVDVQQRKWDLPRVECLTSQMKQHGRVLADRVQHHRAFELRHDLADNVDRFGFELLQMR